MNNFERVREICGGWGLYEEGNSTEQMQILKAISEAGELADSIAKNDREQAKDDIGDILVCLINAYVIGGFGKIEERVDFYCYEMRLIKLMSYMLGGLSRALAGAAEYMTITDFLASIASHFNLTIDECLEQAISEIEKRKGKIVNGVFIKDAN